MITDANIRVDRKQCIACGQCVDRCIMDNLRLSIAPCRQACPLQTNCQGYIRLTAQGKAEEAAAELRKHTLFGRILGRVCTHPCESACTRATEVGDGAVHIRAIKRFLADSYPEIADAPPLAARASGKKAAIIGSGPAGLEAAAHLAEAGHQVTVFERDAQPGGTLRYGVPSFRLPGAELDKSIASLEKGGVTFICNSAQASAETLSKEYDAVIIAGGAPESLGLAVPGADLPGVVRGLEFLRAVHLGQNPVAQKRVLVIGGGGTALDAAMSAKKMQAASVAVVCLEAFRDMPVSADKFIEIAEENLTVHERMAVSAIARADGILKLSLKRCLSLFDAAGRFAPELDEASALPDLEADIVILAVGQRPEKTAFTALQHNERGGLIAEKGTQLAPGMNNIFIAGDCISGPSTVVEAMASGREAAVSVCRLLAGEPLESERDPYAVGGWSREYQTCPQNAQNGPRGEEPRIPAPARSLEKENLTTFSAEQAQHEAERCLSCGRSYEAKHTCWFCLPCEIECPQKALDVRIPYLAR